MIYLTYMKKQKNLSKLRNKQSFTTLEAEKAGISPRMLNHYCAKGLIVRLGQGFYTFPEKQGMDFEALVKEKLLQVSVGVIGLTSALRFYDLTEEAPAKIDILVPKNKRIRREITDVNLYSVSDNIFKIGVVTKNGIKLTSLERTIIDLLKYNSDISTVLGVIKEAKLKKTRINFELLKKYSIRFRVKEKFNIVIEAIS